MRRRTLALGACCSFLTGIGLTALAAWVQLQYENNRETHNVFLQDQTILRLEGDVAASRTEARAGLNHVRSLLRAPRVSDTDKATDRAAAQGWVRNMELD